MATLKKDDMSKESSAGVYAGTKRPDIFDKKIKDGKTFRLRTKTGKEIVGLYYDKKKELLDYYEKQDSKKTIKTAKRSEIFKDEDFGGGSGSGGGAEVTKYTESLQCFYASYVFNVAQKIVKSVSPKQLEEAKTWCHTTATLKQCLDNGPAAWIEDDVYIKTANKLFQEYGRKLTKPVYFHRGSEFMDKIYSAKSKCHKVDKKSDKPQAPGSFGNDKWNPGDIWASTFAPNSDPLGDFTDNWGMLNKKVAELAGETRRKTELLGISLKRIESTSARLKKFRSPKQSEVKNYTYDGFIYGRTGDFFSSQDIYIHTSEGEIQLRTFNRETSWQGEIKMIAAAGGKIGGGNLDFYSSKVFNKTIFPSGGESALFNKPKNLNWIKEFYTLYKNTNSKQLKKQPLMDFERFKILVENSEDKFLNSKYAGLILIDNITKATKKKRDEFIGRIYSYASSDTDQSSFYIKLY